jgi:hypothetical protein
MSVLEHETATSAAAASAGASPAPARAPSPDLGLLVPLQRSACACGGSCASCGGGDDQDRDVPTVMRLAAASSTLPSPAVTPKRLSAGLLHLQAKAGNRAVSRLVATNASRARKDSPPLAAATPPGPAADASRDAEGEVPAKQSRDELMEADAGPPPAGGTPPASPPGASEDGQWAGLPAADVPVAAPTRDDFGPTVTRAGDEEATVQRDDDDDGGGLLGLITGRAESLSGSIRSRGRQIWAALETVIASVVETVTGMAQTVVDRLGRTLGALRELADSLWSSLRERLAAVAEKIQSGFDALRDRLRGVWEGIKQSASGLLERLKAEAAALIERIRSRVVAVAAPASSAGGDCVTSAAIDRAHAVLPAEVDVAIGEFAARSMAGLAGLEGEGAGAEAEGGAGRSAVEADGAAAIAAAGPAAAEAEHQLDGRAAAIRSDSDAGIADVHTQADAAVTRAGERVDGDTTGLDQEGQSGISGLGALLTGLASAVLGRARNVIARVRDNVGDVVGSLARQGTALLGSVGHKVRAILERVRSTVNGIIDSAIALVRDVVARIGSALAALRAAIERITGLLRRLAAAAIQLWSQLRSMVQSAWKRLQGTLASLRARAASLLPASNCDACELRDATQRAERLAATGLGHLDLSSVVAGLRVALKRSGRGPSMAPPAEVVVTRLGRGQPLAGEVRGRMETAFGRSFDGVEVHTDDPAGKLADEMGARAFTVGNHVGFGPAQYRPGTLVGDALLAHELAHVAQDSGRVVARSARSDAAAQTEGPAEEAEEHDADEAAVAAVTRLWSGGGGDPIPIAAAVRSGLAVRRCSKCCEIQPPTGNLRLVEAEHECKPSLQSFGDAQESKRQNKKEGEEDRGYSMGLTGLNMNAVQDAANMSATQSRKCDELCEVNTERLPAFSLSPFYAVGVGSYDRPEGVTFGRGTKQNVPWACRGKPMKKTFRITQAVADQAQAAEVEHCNDLKVGWNRSVAKWLGAVKELGSGFCTPEGKKCDQQFKELVKARSGIENPVPFMNCAQTVSLGRDEPGVHIFPAPRVVEVKKDCSEAIYEFPPLTKLGQPSSQELIDACGK